MRLVLIEDHQALREGLELLLGREGCEVVGHRRHGRRGPPLVEELAPDVAIVDIRLGDDDGIALTRGLLDDDPQRRSPLHRLLRRGPAVQRARLRRAGYALKDGSPRELVEALDAGRRGGSYVDPRLGRRCSRAAPPSGCPSLSNREREVLDLLAQGLTGEQVAERLVLSAETIKTHIRNAMTKLEAHTRVHAIAIALREGYISPPDDAGLGTRA